MRAQRYAAANYVDDSLGVLRSPPFDVDFHLYEAFNQM